VADGAEGEGESVDDEDAVGQQWQRRAIVRRPLLRVQIESVLCGAEGRASERETCRDK
jgi:hypothetical protein